jgi:hypothetical protein
MAMEVVGTQVQGAARRSASHYAQIQETTNKGRREKRARPKDNDVKETLRRRREGMGSLCSRAKPQEPATIHICGGKEEEHDQKCASKGEKGGFTVPTRVNSST